MKDEPTASRNRKILKNTILEAAQDSQDMADEIYLQVANQLTDNEGQVYI